MGLAAEAAAAVTTPRAGQGQRPTDQRTGDFTLDTIQRGTRDLSDQLEDLRRGLLVGDVSTSSVDKEIGEEMVVAYSGNGGGKFYLPSAQLRGLGRGMLLVILHRGQGYLTVLISGTDTVNGAASFQLAARQMVLLVSDGGTAWTATVSGDAADFNSFRHSSGGGGAALNIAGLANGTLLIASAMVANVMLAMPFIAPRRGGRIDQLACNVTVAVAGNLRLGLWDNVSESVLYPNRLLADSGSISHAAPGVKTFSVNINLVPGQVYYLSLVTSGAPTVRGLAVGGCAPFWGLDTAMGTAPQVGLQVAFAFGALPNVYPAGSTYLTTPPLPALAYRMPV